MRERLERIGVLYSNQPVVLGFSLEEMSDRGWQLSWHRSRGLYAGKVLLKIFAGRLSDY